VEQSRHLHTTMLRLGLAVCVLFTAFCVAVGFRFAATTQAQGQGGPPPPPLTSVTHDNSLTGAGTTASPLGVAIGGVQTGHLANAAVTLPKLAISGSPALGSSVGYNGSGLVWQPANIPSPNIPSSRSYLSSDTGIAPSANPQSGVLINWDVVQYDTLGAIQVQPWRYTAPTAGRYRVSTFIRYRPNGVILAGQVVQVEVFVNGNDYGGLGGFQASDTNGAEVFIQGEDEIAASAGDQITINLFQNTGQAGSVTTASHVLVARLGAGL